MPTSRPPGQNQPDTDHRLRAPGNRTAGLAPGALDSRALAPVWDHRSTRVRLRRPPGSGGEMREYSTPAAVDIPASATLADVVFERAARSPAAVVIRAKSGTVLAPTPGDGSWRDITARQFA